MKKTSMTCIVIMLVMLAGLRVSAQELDGVPSDVYEGRYNEAVAYFNEHPETTGIHGSLNTIELSPAGEKYRPNKNICLCINPEYSDKEVIGSVSLSNMGDSYLEDVAAAEICAALYAFNIDLKSVEEAIRQMQNDISSTGTTKKSGISYRNDSFGKTILLTWEYDRFRELSAAAENEGDDEADSNEQKAAAESSDAVKADTAAAGSPLADAENPEKETDAEKGPLSKGSKGDAVKEMQKMLIELGYLSGEADGQFGGKTEAAVKAYQADNSLKDTGAVDEATYNKMKTSMTVLSAAKANSGRVFDDVSSLAGENGTDKAKTVYTDKETIRKVQEMLNKAGYDCGLADGVSGKKTGTQILAFKKDHALPENTDITPDLLEALEPGSRLNPVNNEKTVPGR